MTYHEETIQQKLTRSYFLLVSILLLITAAFILPAQLKERNDALEQEISWTGYLLSQNTEVISGMQNKSFSDTLQNTLNEIIQNSNDIDYIVFADTNSTRIFHPDRSQIGQTFVGGDETAILQETPPYITEMKGTHDIQKRSFHQIHDDFGNVLGFVMVSASLSTVRRAQYQLLGKFLLIFLGLTALGMLFAAYTAARLRSSLLGYEPAAIVKMFQQRDEILEKIEDGILAYDHTFHKLYSNLSASKLLGAEYDIITDTAIWGLGQKCMKDQITFTSIPHEYSGKTLVINVLPLISHKQTAGFLLILRDRTEILELADQLNGSAHIVEALRASTHEFLNKLHVISGMLQMKNYDQAIVFLDGLSHETQNSYQSVIQQIHNKTIAALLLGKQSRAKELNIDFTIQKDCYLDASNEFLTTKELVTVIGNLIENAFHAVEDADHIRQVQFFILQTADGLTIISDDTGCGMTEPQIQELMNGSFTTRGEGHGIGFRLIREIVHKHNGYLSVDSEPGIGSSFTISIKKHEVKKYD